LKLRVINLVAQHDVTADEQFPGRGHFGFGPTAARFQALIETL